MEAQGTDGILKLSETHISITWTSLRRRLQAASGADIEVLPLERIFDHTLVQATPTKVGSLQIRLVNQFGSLTPLNRESQLENSYIDRLIIHSVTFHEINLPSFVSLHNELQLRVTKAKSRMLDQIIGLNRDVASN